MSEPKPARPDAPPALPPLPLLIFAAIDLSLAFFLLVDGGFTIHFALVAAIGAVLALLGLRALRHAQLEKPPD